MHAIVEKLINMDRSTTPPPVQSIVVIVHSVLPFHLTSIVATLTLARDQGKGVERLRAYK